MAEENIGILTCPKCKHTQEMEIPNDKCILFFRCDNCGNLIKASKDSCVFCEYGDKDCPIGHPEKQQA